MPSKKSGRAGKLMRFMKPQGPNQPNFAVPELKVKRNVANLSIRQYMGIEEVRQTETKGAFYASTNGNPRRANKPKKGKPQMVSRPKNGFDVLSKDEAKHQEEEPQVKANAFTVTRVEPVDTDEPREESQEPKEDSVSELSQGDQKILEEFDAKQKAEQEERASPDYSWRYKPELPTADELCPEPDTEVAISPNIIDGAWATKEAYLKTHYDLCREDALGPLIDAVAAVREKPGMCDDNKTCIYEKVG
ncbi:hypothetical protein KEM55_007969 [Ascosphaera atra]|nr:hypothetical protein KEM55_007969 [Ascosphaera atra]